MATGAGINRVAGGQPHADSRSLPEQGRIGIAESRQGFRIPVPRVKEMTDLYELGSELYSLRLTMDDAGHLEDWGIECQQGVALGLMAAAAINNRRSRVCRVHTSDNLAHGGTTSPHCLAVGLHRLPQPCAELAVG